MSDSNLNLTTQNRFFSATRKLAPEVLSLIFEATVPAFSFSENVQSFDNTGIPCWPRPPFSHLVFGAVCSQWRQATLTAPSLWRDIYLDLNKSSKSAASLKAILKLYLERSGGLPLNVLVDFSQSRTPFQDVFHKIFLTKAANRVQTLILFNANRSVASQLSNAMPLLKHLFLVFHCSSLSTVLPPETLDITGAFSLSSFVYRVITLDVPPTCNVILPWTSIVHFNARELHPRSSVEVLIRCPNLESYSARVDNLPFIPGIQDVVGLSEPLVLHHLRSFESPSPIEGYTDLHRWLHMPRLQSLSLDYRTRFDTEPWAIFLDNLPKTITHLQLRGFPDWDETEGCPDTIFEHMPRLQSLRIDLAWYDFLTEVCTTLAKQTVLGVPKYSPELRCIVVLSRDSVQDGSPAMIQCRLQQMLEARYNGNSPLPNYEFKIMMQENGNELHHVISLDWN